MENDILDSLNDLGYSGPLSEEIALSKALDGGPKSVEYTKLVHTLADELKKLCKLEETVNPITEPEDSNSFLMELSSFLKELGCPYLNMITGHISSRLQKREERILLLDYLLSELMAARMVSIDKPKDDKASMDIIMQETPTAKDLKEILIALKFNKPPPNITPELLFNKLVVKLKETIDKEGDKFVGKPLYNKALTENQWKDLEKTFVEMFEEYKIRREMLLTRLECTVQSFEWSDRLKGKKEQIQSVYRPKREAMRVRPNVRLSDFLAARTTIVQVEKTSSANVRKNTRTDVNKVIIGRVPDRGGRAYEQEPPPPEMPSWQQRSNQGGGGGGGRGGGGGAPRGFGGGAPRGGGSSRGARGGGGRVQGGWSQGDNRGQGNQSGYSGRPATASGYQTYEVPQGSYQGQQAGFNQGSYNQGQNYNQNGGGYNQGSGGYNQKSGGYGQGSGGYNQESGGYSQGSGGYSQGSGGYNQSSYNQRGGGHKGYRGGYQNEHDDRTSGRSNYNRGGRR